MDFPRNVKFNGSILSFDKVEGAKFYIIYKSNEKIKFIKDEIIDMIGNPENKDRIEWKENTEGKYKYGLRAISYSNTLGNTTSDVSYNQDDSSSSQTNVISLILLCFFVSLLFSIKVIKKNNLKK